MSLNKAEENKILLIELLDNIRIRGIFYKEVNKNSFKITGGYFKELIVYPTKCKVVFISPHNGQTNSCNYNGEMDLLEKLIVSGKYKLNKFNDLVDYETK